MALAALMFSFVVGQFFPRHLVSFLFPPRCSFMSNTYTGINNSGAYVLTSINIHEHVFLFIP